MTEIKALSPRRTLHDIILRSCLPGVTGLATITALKQVADRARAKLYICTSDRECAANKRFEFRQVGSMGFSQGYTNIFLHVVPDSCQLQRLRSAVATSNDYHESGFCWSAPKPVTEHSPIRRHGIVHNLCRLVPQARMDHTASFHHDHHGRSSDVLRFARRHQEQRWNLCSARLRDNVLQRVLHPILGVAFFYFEGNSTEALNDVC